MSDEIIITRKKAIAIAVLFVMFSGIISYTSFDAGVQYESDRMWKIGISHGMAKGIITYDYYLENKDNETALELINHNSILPYIQSIEEDNTTEQAQYLCLDDYYGYCSYYHFYPTYVNNSTAYWYFHQDGRMEQEREHRK